MAIDPQLMRESIEIAASHEPVITKRFYEILFSRYPQVRPLFSHNAPERQQQMLQESILAALDHIEDAAWLADTMGGLGVKHLDYGVTDEMYDWVGECLIASLADLCGEAWTPAHEESWAEAYGVLASLAIAGADRVRANA